MESLAACGEHEEPDLEMYFTVNLAFIDYLEELNETINTPINRNWTSVKQPLPVSLESFQLSSKLMQTPIMLRDFIDQYQENAITATKWKSPTSKFRSFINSFLIDMLVFIAAILTVFIIFVIIYIIMGQSKLKVLVVTMALQRVRAVEALNTNRQTQKLQFRVAKNLNDPKSGYSGVTTSKKNQKECVLLGTTLFQHGKDKIISGRYKMLCFIRSKQNSWEYPFVQIDRRTVIGKCYFKKELDMGCV